MAHVAGESIGDTLETEDGSLRETSERPRRGEPHPTRLGPDEDYLRRRLGHRQREILTIIIERSALFRAGLEHILAATRFRVIGGYPSVYDVPPKATQRPPSLLLIGFDAESRAALSELADLRAALRDPRVVMLSNYLDADEFLAALDAGGDGYLLRDEITPDVLLTSLEVVLLGGMVIPRGLTELLRCVPAMAAEPPIAHHSHVGPEQTPPSPVDGSPEACAGLTNREQAILEHVMRGASNKHIARELAIAEATVKVHVKSLLRKIHVQNRTQAAMWGINNIKHSTN